MEKSHRIHELLVTGDDYLPIMLQPQSTGKSQKLCISGYEETKVNAVDEWLLEDVKMFTDQEVIKMVTQESGHNSEESVNEADGTTEQSVQALSLIHI